MDELAKIQSLLKSVWPEWRVTRRIGKGTYGAVYEIIRDDLGSGYKCALKVLEMEVDDLESPADPTVQVLDPYGTVSARPHPFSADSGANENTQGIRSLAADSPVPQIFQGLPSESQTDLLEEFVRGVSREIDLMVRLKGTPNIVSIEDYIVLRGRNIRTILIRMELLEGVDRIAEQGHGLPCKEVIRLGTDICSALTRCEEKNILHRDIKPGNIFYSENAGYKLGDFGISRTMESIHEKMSMSGVGTVQYMAPEVYFGSRYDNTVDIYSLGLTLYTLLNNNLPPFCEYSSLRPDSCSSGTGRRREANMRRLKGETLPAPANTDDRLAEVVLRACDPDPAKRYRTAEDFRRALKDCDDEKAGGGSGGTGKPPAGPVPRALLIGLAGLVLIGVGIFMIGRGGGSSAGSKTTYTVLYEDGDGNVLEMQELDGVEGERVTCTAPPREGYQLETGTKTLVLSEDTSQNVFVFIYKEEGEEAPDQAEPVTEEGTGRPEAAVQAAQQEKEESAAITWSDRSLEKAVRNYTGLTGEITPARAAKIEDLVLDEADLSDISDLKYFTGLQTLSLANNFIEDVSPLSGLSHLVDLNLEKNMISDVSPLKNLTDLRELDLYQNSISDIEALSGLTSLTMLDLRENNVSDIGALSGMHSMKELYLSDNVEISDMDPVSGMPELHYLSVKNTKVRDVSAVSGADRLSTLVLGGSDVSDLSPVETLPKLDYLDVRNCPLKSTAVLDRLKKRGGIKIEY